MTIDQTRQLGIEFERRIQTMIPEAEYTSKLDTETIYSYLNLYQDKFIKDIYRSLDTIPTPSKPSAHIETILSCLIKTFNVDVIAVQSNLAISYEYDLPDDFGLYLNSSTDVSKSYEYKVEDEKLHGGKLPTVLMSASYVTDLFNRPQDSMRIIRQPIGYISKPQSNRTICVIYDRYTTPVRFNLTYYKVPLYMNLFTSTPCELPMDTFEDLVSGAVDMYVLYVAGAEARKKHIAEQANLQRNKKLTEE